MNRTMRSDVCPSCGTALRWSPPDGWGVGCGMWVCPRCKYKRPDGAAVNPWKALKPKKRVKRK